MEESTETKETVQEIVTPEGQVSEDTKEHEDSQKIKVPDPSIDEEAGKMQPLETPDKDNIEDTTLIEGAWADILGSGQLKKKTVKKGIPNTRPTTNEICTIKISGQLVDGKAVDVQEKFSFQLGDLEVIQGIDLIVALMDCHEISQVEVQPRFAYGSLGNGKDIPPEATILYTIELLEVSKETDLELVNIDERLRIGNAKRERGNWWYSRGDFTSSIQCYRRALDYLDTENETETDSPEKLQEILDDRLKVYNNMAAAQMKIEAYDAALKSVDNVLRCQKDNVKAIYRKSKIVTAMGKMGEGIALLERALHLDPSTKIVQQDLMRLQAKQKLEVQKEKSLYKKMFNLNSTPAPTTSQGKPKVKLTVPWTLMIGAVTAVVASYVTYRFKLF
ncbi:peptidyl-prolyl cis-trans isomerase FKBP8-like isoform X1 [Daphnia pulex]|uniref:peptidyl-prolyl cis-trans isomerase FKBP8-like isoform X1 n=2 Tax=Daphnia pulex TaxID=6669 RepID=UPI001EDF93D7|nr:peptidyl-prolyl cis-trans isomerase FKBP8-like isoform X1 [Daphnia pulex]